MQLNLTYINGHIQYLGEVYGKITPFGVGEKVVTESLKGKLEEHKVMDLLYLLLRGGLIWCPVPHVYCRSEGSE